MHSQLLESWQPTAGILAANCWNLGSQLLESWQSTAADTQSIRCQYTVNTLSIHSQYAVNAQSTDNQYANMWEAKIKTFILINSPKLFWTFCNREEVPIVN
jgi:hypothetical protein